MECLYAADIMDQVALWLHQGRPVVVATIVDVIGSSSRPLGTRMVCTDHDEFVGAVSGGCVETDVYRIAGVVMEDRTPRVIHYGKVRDPILDVGLNCDGEIDVLVEPIDEQWYRDTRQSFIGIVKLTCSVTDVTSPGSGTSSDEVSSRSFLNGEIPSGTSTSVTVTRTWTPLGPEEADNVFVSSEAWQTGTPQSRRNDVTITVDEPVLPPPLLLIFGAGPVADDLARMASVMGYTTVISDPRESRFRGTNRFSEERRLGRTDRIADTTQSPADHICVSWPDETFRTIAAIGLRLIPQRTYIVSLEHEPRFEDALWLALLGLMCGDGGSPAASGEPAASVQSGDSPPPSPYFRLSRRPAYIGAIGKAQRAIERDQRAFDKGVDLSPLRPIHTPIGLDIGGKSSGEIALSILSQIVATLHGRTGGAMFSRREATVNLSRL